MTTAYVTVMDARPRSGWLVALRTGDLIEHRRLTAAKHDPEAARVTLRSGIPIMLSPLNVSRKTALTKAWYEEMVVSDTPITALLRETMGPNFDREPDRVWLMYDQVAMASLIDPTLVTTTELIVDVDIAHGIDYGVSVGGEEPWPGAQGANRMKVQHDLDWPRFIEMFVARVRAPLRAPAR